MNWDLVDWQALSRMRAAFLEETAGATDYWRDESDLESYDFTFAQRIGWKWEFVLRELKRLGWQPPQGGVLDWGCGTGIAGRIYQEHFPSKAMTLFDRSTPAIQFAARRLAERFPAVEITTGLRPCPTLLLSHVLTELTDEELDVLLSLAAQSTTMIWVEPGTFNASRRLIAIRERLRDQFQIVAPCTHQHRCGMLTPDNARHWCHFFAPSPVEIFTDSNWAKFANLAGVDLRSLPVSYLVLDRRPAAVFPTGATRVIGRGRMFKGYAMLLGCGADGVRDCRLTKSQLPEEFSKQRKGKSDSLQIWRRDGGEIVRVSEV